jgi:hypothetical protein
MPPEDRIACAVSGLIDGNLVRKDSARVSDSGILGYLPLEDLVAYKILFNIISSVNSAE